MLVVWKWLGCLGPVVQDINISLGASPSTSHFTGRKRCIPLVRIVTGLDDQPYTDFKGRRKKMSYSHCLKTAVVASSFVITTVAASPVVAAEHGALNYPHGSPGVLLGEFPPLPGLFLVAQTTYATSDGLYDGDGDEIRDEDFEMETWVETFRFLASYPTELWGARLYSQVVLPLVNVQTSLGVETPVGKMEIFDDDDSGLANITVSPLIMNWQFRESHQYITLGLDLALEWGASYDEEKEVNAGTGYTSIIPVAAYRYDDPSGLDAGIKANLMFNLENDATDYESGDMIALDFYAGWNIGKWKVGVVGGYSNQFEADEQYGVKVDESEMMALNIGPSLSYSAGPFIINFNYQKGVAAENISLNDYCWFNVTVPLYVPNRPR